jgi:flagellar biosynthesis protein FlhF
MRLKLYRAASVPEAMAQLRAELGPEALILSTRRAGNGVELTAALEVDDEPPPLAQADLAYHGVPGRLAARLEGPFLAASLAGMLRFGALPIAPTRPLLMAGLPGAGKTLSVARLATRLVLSGLRPAVITADGRRAGAAEELAAYTRLLGLELMVADTPAKLVRALATPACGADSPVLIDSSGINPFVPAEMAGLVALAQAAHAWPVLVMAAGQLAEEAIEQVQAFAPLAAEYLLPTRLDLVRRVGSIVAAAEVGNLVLTEAGMGSGATQAVMDITPEFLAGRLERPVSNLPPVAANRRPVFQTEGAGAASSWSIERHG